MPYSPSLAQIVYPSVDAEVMVGPYILRLVFPGDPTARQELVKPDKPLSAAVTPEFLTQLMYRLLGDSNAAVRLACVRAMERVLATATTPPSPLHILGHMVHLVCVSNGVLPDHIESEEWIATSRLDVSAGALPTLVAADILGVDLQVCCCIPLWPWTILELVFYKCSLSC